VLYRYCIVTQYTTFPPSHMKLIRRRLRIESWNYSVGTYPRNRHLSQWKLHPIKPTYQLKASAFNRLGQYTNSLGYRAYWNAELGVLFPGNGRRTITSTHLHLPTEGCPGWVDIGGWLDRDKFLWPGFELRPQSPIPVLTGPGVKQLRWCHQRRYHFAKLPQCKADKVVKVQNIIEFCTVHQFLAYLCTLCTFHTFC